MAGLTPDPASLARFSAGLDRLVGHEPLGLAVSGGGDSMALLLLAAAARPGGVTAISVDHGLRREAATEVGAVANLADRLGVSHRSVRLDLEPGGNLQARAREARYRAIEQVAHDEKLAAVATAHHADDQAETLLMRLARGAGLRGLSGIRPIQHVGGLRVIRPLLDWRHAELLAICRGCGIAWAEDPSNHDPRFDRARVRSAMERLDLDVGAVASSARFLAEAEEALEWASHFLSRRLRREGEGLEIAANDLPPELVRRLILRGMADLGAPTPRGPDLERALSRIGDGHTANLSGLMLSSGPDGTIRLAPEPPRRG